MVRLSPISSRELIRIVRTLGFEEVHRKGSHRTFLHPVSRATTTIPDYGGEDIHRGLLHKILADIGIGLEEFERLRR